jgi:type VII secretion-associated serine protease mycosin
MWPRWLTVLALTLAVAPAVPAPAAYAAAGTCRLAPTSTVSDLPWAQRRLDVARAWRVSQGAGVVVGVVDTGVDARHPMLAHHVLPGVDVVNGTGPAWTDCQGHGTFVAGIVAARHVDGFGFEGVAPAATILPIRQTNDGNDGTAHSLAASIVAAVDGGASVINVSIVIATSAPELASAVTYARDHDVLLVAAAGNDARQGNAAEYPAAYPGVVAVGAVGPDDKPTSFSASGEPVSVVAPGSDILGPGAGGPGLVSGQQGTSFAAPFVAGVAALVRAYRPQLSAAQVKHRIEATADHPAAALPDRQLGWGVVNPYRAVTEVLPEEQGTAADTARAGRLPARTRAGGPVVDDRPAVFAALGLALGAGLILVGALIVARGRQRGWRPAERGAVPAERGAVPAGHGGGR